MALRDKLRERMQPFLEPGEQICEVFYVQTGPNPWWMFLTTWIVFATRYYVVAVTDRGIVVARSKWYFPTKPVQATGRLPRELTMGPLKGLWGGPLYLTPDGKKSWVHKRFQKDVAAADADLQASGTTPLGNASQKPHPQPAAVPSPTDAALPAPTGQETSF